MTAPEKPCTVCGQEKPLGDFNRRKGSRDGRESCCKACKGRKRQAWRQANPEKGREYQRRWREKNPTYRKQWEEQNPDRLAEKCRRARELHPLKARARDAVNAAVRYGRMTKPDRCEDCGEPNTEPRGLHGHHEDYGEPLEVVWVCKDCHFARHGRENVHA